MLDRAVALIIVLAPGTALALSTSASWTYEGSQDTENLGMAAASIGDVNGDGFDDIAAGAPEWDGDAQDMGRVVVFYGSASGLNEAPDWSAEGRVEAAQFGISVAGAGDVNGDGFDDLIVGADGDDSGDGPTGGAFLFLGSASGLQSTPTWEASGDADLDRFGAAVAGVGDIDGDGRDDVVVGAFRFTDVQVRQGRAFLFRGAGTSVEMSPSWSFEGTDPGENLGASISAAGDVNGDGNDDVLIAAPGYSDDFANNSGRVHLFLGSASGLGDTPNWTEAPSWPQASFGLSMAPVGDVNGDEYDDVVIGSAPEDLLNLPGDRVVLYLGGPEGLDPDELWSGLYSEYPHHHIAVAGPGDVDGDGRPDLLVGREVLWLDQHGDAFLYSGGDDGFGEPVWHVTPEKASMLYGSSVAGADVDGDGLADLLVGARGYNGDHLNAGRLMLYLAAETNVGDDDDDDDDGTGDDDDFNPEIFGDGGDELATGPCVSSMNSTSGGGPSVLLLVAAGLMRRRS
jgi:hypothetical protein